MSTEYGDADLMGGATLGDLGTLAVSFVSTRTDFGWADGDFNWDGEVTLGDLGLLAANFGPDNGPVQAEFEQAVADLLGASVADLIPEPAAIAILGLGALTLLRRSRHPDAGRHVGKAQAEAKAEPTSHWGPGHSGLNRRR